MFAAGNTNRSSWMAPASCYGASPAAAPVSTMRPTGLLMDATAAWRHNRCVCVRTAHSEGTT
jgi:hypothetical protein